jgi:hypothetical protein
MTEQQFRNSVHPIKIIHCVEKLIEPFIILIDGLDYVIHKIGFKETFTLIQNLNDICYMQNHIVL